MANSSLPKKPQLDPALGYQQFEAILSRAERKISTTAPPLAGYPPEYVGRRLVQRIVELALYPCVQAAAANYVRGLEPIISTTYPLEIGGLRFHNDEVAVTRTTWLRNVADFCAQWLRVLAYLAGLNRNAISAKRATLLSGVGLGDITVDGSDARFAGFCAHGSLSPIHNASHLIVECAQSLKSTNPGWISYARQPMLALFRAHPPRGRDLLCFLSRHIATALSFFRYCLSHPLASLLGRDMAYHAVASDLNRRGALENIAITNAHFHVQPLWMHSLPERQFKAHMLWCSQNTKPFVFKSERVLSHLPNYRHMMVDEHWVWTAGYAKYLTKLGIKAKINIVGPILWHLPEATSTTAHTPSVTIFDVTPITETFSHQIGLPRNYYSPRNMIDFLEKVTLACERVAVRIKQPVLVFLKHKRHHAGVHDPRYIAFVDSLVSSGRIQLLSPQTNLYSLIAKSSAVVVAPFSSPAYVANRLEVPAIYFDATDSIEPTHDPAPFVSFTSDTNELVEKLYHALQGPL
ncbi:MAG: polysaccharide biosynthesis PFTS motif protein [Betaproteobacteria bacterium]|jgi:hypothetical protein